MKILSNHKGITLIETLFAAIALAIMATAMYPTDNSTEIAANVQSAVDVHNTQLQSRQSQVAGAFQTLDGIVNPTQVRWY
jgi:Tfp pilus assembly protein PilE